MAPNNKRNASLPPHRSGQSNSRGRVVGGGGGGGEGGLVMAVVVVLMTAVNYGLLDTVTLLQPTPYLDEVFHVPQTQAYCNGSYETWDPKITTLPGTYVLASSSLNFLQRLGFLMDGCTVYNLRLVNMVLGLLNFHIIWKILCIHMVGTSQMKIVLAAVNISIFPVMYFFNFLFYTDVSSTLWLLLMHWMYLTDRFYLSAIFGGLATFTRQTNVVWVAWHGLLILLNVVQQAYRSGVFASICAYHMTKRSKPINKGKGKKNKKNSSVGICEDVSFIQTCKDLGYYTFSLVKVELPSLSGYLTCVLTFVMFVFYNGSIVVGDKSAHTASINIPQIGYFTIVYGFFCNGFIFTRLRSTFRLMTEHILAVSVAIVVFLYVVEFNTVAHPYLLADNRHYPFYLWQRLFQTNHVIRFLLVPCYVVVWFFIFCNIPEKLSPNYGLALFICAVVQLVPQLLLEFRYFIPIYLFARVVMPKPTWLELILEFILNFTINAVTFQLFMYKPFYWSNSTDVQRFMW